MAVLLIGEVTDGTLALDATANAVTAAKQLGDVTGANQGDGVHSCGTACRRCCSFGSLIFI